MRFQLLSPWPVAQWLIPVSFVLECRANFHPAACPSIEQPYVLPGRGVMEVIEAPRWNGIALPLPMPMQSLALDQEAADWLARWYPRHLHLLRAADGIVIPNV